MGDLPNSDMYLERLVRIETKIDHYLNMAEDHERRVRLLEQFKWRFPTAALVISALSLCMACLAIFLG